MISSTALVGCATHDVAAPGISPQEMHVLTSEYYWQRNLPPPHYTPQQLDALLRASADPTLDGERSEAQASKLAVALATVGDQRFADALSRQSDRVRRRVSFFISGLWTDSGLHYPKTQALLQPYT